MILKEAFKLLRRFEDHRLGRDWRPYAAAFDDADYSQAIKMILASQGLNETIADCISCKHRDELPGIGCSLGVRGECTKYELEEVRL